MTKISITTNDGIVAEIIDLDNDPEYADYDLRKSLHRQSLMEIIVSALKVAYHIEKNQ